MCLVPYTHASSCTEGVLLSVDLESGIIPEDEDEQETYDDIGVPEEHNFSPAPAPAPSEPIDDDIYEELPGNPAPSPLGLVQT